MGPLPVSIEGCLYWLTITDDYSRYAWVFPIKNKSSATIAEKFESWKRDAENKKTGRLVKYIRIDGGTEFQARMSEALKDKGITITMTAFYTPQSNGVAERLNRTLSEAVRAMQIHAGVPKTF